MPHDVPGEVHWHEPAGGEQAGLTSFRRPASTYDDFMATEGIPCFRGLGIDSVMNLPLAPWRRLGGRGSYIQLHGTEGKWGSYVVEVPTGGATTPERHLFDEVFLVLAGRGSTEIWSDGDEPRHAFEWQTGSLFSVPFNAWHRLVNGSATPSLLLVGTTAPVIVNHLGDPAAVFDPPWQFRKRNAATSSEHTPGIEPDPVRPLDNRRSPGYRRLEPSLAGDAFQVSIGQHRTGRYARAYASGAPAMTICLKGRGYTYLWPDHAGPTPWRDGKAELVRRVDYQQFGLGATAPSGRRWYHQHFGVAPEPLRLATWYGPQGPGHEPGPPGEVRVDETLIELARGGTAIPYHSEDPHLRVEWQKALAATGSDDRMLPSFYDPPPS